MHTNDTFTPWKLWPVSASTRERIEAYRRKNPGEEVVIGNIDGDGSVLGALGDLPEMKNISQADFARRTRFALDIVLLDDKVLVRKDFRGDRAHFVREWHNLVSLYGRANVPAVYRVDEERCWLYKNLLPGRTIRDILVARGARILNLQTEGDPELAGLDRESRIEAILARGTALVPSCVSEELLQEMECQLERIHACGVTGMSLTFGNIIIDSQRGAPWFVDWEGARVHRTKSDLAFTYQRNLDRIKFNRFYSRNLMTEHSARVALANSGLDWYAPVDFGGGVTVDGFWSTSSGTGRWEFLNRKVMEPLVKGKRILDLGSNNGVMPLMMLRAGAREVVGVEISPTLAERAELVHKIFEWRDMRRYVFHIHQGDMREIMQKSWGNFDVVTALASLYYLPPDEMGAVVCRASELAPMMVIQAKTDTRQNAPESKAEKSSVAFLKKLLQENGFPHVDVYESKGYPRPLLVGRADID
jgi:2-polyprenyl-3-methyl-5-hydroxy-6-metoxy-1,4-benzoquinol methylase